MVTSADSKIRILDGHEVVSKYKGISMYHNFFKCFMISIFWDRVDEKEEHCLFMMFH